MLYIIVVLFKSKLAKPNKPRIVKAATTLNSSEIEWNLDDDGGLKISNLLIEWSKNFTSGVDGTYSLYK